ncbi:MAG: flavodoxin family protein [Desulfohalobiaceae bacterium]
MADLVAVYGSPRRRGNTSTLLGQAVQGVREQGLTVQEFFLQEQKISPCLELYHCQKKGECSIKDDFQSLRDEILQARGLILASPIFFYSVTAQTKAFMDRFQSLWVKKYLLDQVEFGQWEAKRLGLFISAGATKGKRLFEGTLLSVKYFLMFWICSFGTPFCTGAWTGKKIFWPIQSICRRLVLRVWSWPRPCMKVFRLLQRPGNKREAGEIRCKKGWQ